MNRDTVVFVCEHGTVKSTIAAYWFNRLAAEKGLPLRAVSRGLEPDPDIPPPVRARLGEDGFDTSAFAPARLSAQDAAAAGRVVGIGVPAESLSAAEAGRRESWDGIPPASTDYAASRDALRARIATLLERLAGERPPRP